MPPKPPKGKKPPLLIEGVDTTDMNFQQLQQYCMGIYDKLLKEREERNYFQLERDKLRSYWEISKRQLDEARALLRVKDQELELVEEKRLHDVNEINQKVKYLQYEQSLEINQMIIKEKNTLELAEQSYLDEAMELLNDKKELKGKLKTTEEKQNLESKQLRIEHAKEITEIRQEFEKKSEELQNIFEKKLNNVKTQLETKHKLEITEIEERKNTQIKVLTENHEKAFDDIRNYYNNITLNNFSLIRNLKENIEDMKRRDAIKDKNLKEVLKENKALTEHTVKAKSAMDLIKHELATYKKETIGVTSVRRELRKTILALDKLTWDYDVLHLRFENSREEKSKTEADKMLQAINSQREVGGRIVYLEEKIKALRGQVERRENLVNRIRRGLQQGRAMGDRGPVMMEMTNVIKEYDDLRTRRMTHRQSLLFN